MELIPTQQSSRTNSNPPLVTRVALAVMVPALLFAFLWSTAGFPVRWERLDRVVLLWVILYVPAKLLRILVHRERGLLRNNQLLLRSLEVSAFGIWAAVSVYGLVQYGLLVIPGSVLIAYLLYNFGHGIIRGHDD